MNPEQEREEIKDGLAVMLAQSTDALRAAIVAQANGESIPQETLSAMVALQENYLALCTRAAVLDGTQIPARPTWLDPPSVEKVIDHYFPQTGVAKALFEALFEIANRLQALESKPSITRAQLRTWLQNKAQ